MEKLIEDLYERAEAFESLLAIFPERENDFINNFVIEANALYTVVKEIDDDLLTFILRDAIELMCHYTQYKNIKLMTLLFRLNQDDIRKGDDYSENL